MEALGFDEATIEAGTLLQVLLRQRARRLCDVVTLDLGEARGPALSRVSRRDERRMCSARTSFRSGRLGVGRGESA